MTSTLVRAREGAVKRPLDRVSPSLFCEDQAIRPRGRAKTLASWCSAKFSPRAVLPCSSRHRPSLHRNERSVRRRCRSRLTVGTALHSPLSEVTAHARDLLALSRGNDGQVAHQEPKLLRDLLIVSRRWMSRLPIGSLVPRRIGLLVKEALAFAANVVTPDRAGLTLRVEISRFRAGKLVVSQQFENLVEARDLWLNTGNAFLGDNATADTPHCRYCGPH